jgi:putative membrane-bound dehydrogenase-like protein
MIRARALPFLVLVLAFFAKVAKPAPERIPPRTPAESRTAFVVAPGFRVELVAAEPLVQSPVACDFDEDGRLYVAELPEYNAYAATKPHGKGRVVRLDDTDGDGVFDKRTVFADNLDYPTGLICYAGGLYVGAAPELLYLKDTNNDGKADERRVIISGFGKDKAGEGQLNSFRWTLENRILISTGLDGGELRAPDGRVVNVRNMNVLLDPRNNSWDVTSGGGQHGMTVDDFGRVFVSGNSDPIHALAYDARYLKDTPLVQAPPAAVNILPTGKFTKLHRISPVESWRDLRTRLRKAGKVPGSDEGGSPSGFFTGATGVTVYRGDAFPAEYRGDLFVGEVSNNLVFRAKLKPDGSLPVAERADADREFLASKDVWFRPVQFANAPDGCLYALDMYRELIEGAAFLAPEVLKTVDPSAGIDKGRIWRIVPDGHKRRPPPRLSTATVDQLIDLLDHPNGWHRDTAGRLLYERRPLTSEAKSRLERLAREAKTPQGRVHAMHALAPFAGLYDNLLNAALKDADPNVRRHALRLAEQNAIDKPRLIARDDLFRLRLDPEPSVRVQLAYSLRHIHVAAQPGDLAGVYAQLAVRDLGDPWMRLALLAGIPSDQQGTVVYSLALSQFTRNRPEGRAFLLALTEQAAAEANGAHASYLVSALSDLAQGRSGVRPDTPFARSFLRAIRTRGSPQTLQQFDSEDSGIPVKALADYLTKDAMRSARETRNSPEVRVAAIHDLQMLPYRDAAPVLADTLQASEPPAVQVATLEVLGRYTDDAVPTLVLGAWKAMTPQVRATATEVLLGRNNWVSAFLDAVESKKVARSDVDPARAAVLMKSPARNIRARAAKLFVAPADRQKVFNDYRTALDRKGDPTKGKALFKAHCAACHKLEGVGEDVGADLKAIRDRGTEGVLLNILDPNREVKPQFLTYAAELTSGRAITGMLVAESATGLTIRRADGISESVPRADVESLRSLGVSYMPEGLEKQLDVPAMADLLAYLNSIR